MRVGKSIFIGLILILVVFNIGHSSQLHVRSGDPVYDYLERMATRGLLPGYMDDTRPLTRDYIAEQLQRLDEQRPELSRIEKEILDEYLADYRYELTEDRHFHISEDRSTYHTFRSMKTFAHAFKEAFQYSPSREELHLVTYEENDNLIWLDWNEMGRYERKGSTNRLLTQHSYRLAMQLGKNFSLYSDTRIFDVQYDKNFNNPPDEYKGGFLASGREGSFGFDREFSFDYANAYVQYTSNFGRFSLASEPLVWGNSQHSTILSNNVDPFPFISWSKMIRQFRFSFFHGSILPAEPAETDPETGSVTFGEKYLVGHRWEFALSDKFQGAFTEMLVYGDRDPELIYFIPTVFLWPVQHNLTVRNQDNILWYFEGEYYPIDGVKLYGTLMIDELQLDKIFKDYYRNQWIIQGGLLVTPNIGWRPTDLTVEFTAVRPWVYTHRVPLYGTYTHNGRGLGFYAGPNSQLLHIENRWWLDARQHLAVQFEQLKDGTNPNEPGDNDYYPLGNDPNQNYMHRDPALDNSTGWLVGDIRTSRELGLSWSYDLTNVFRTELGIARRWEKDENYNLYSLQVRFDI